MRGRKENLFSFHLACAIFPVVTFKVHGEGVGFMGTKVQFFFTCCPKYGEYYIDYIMGHIVITNTPE